MQQENLELVRCDGFQQLGGIQSENEQEYVIKNNLLYIVRKDDERDELRSVLSALGLRLGAEQIEKILRGLTDADVKAARDAVRRCSTDEERLLKAVGEANLRQHLPQGLLAILEGTQGPLTGVHMAQAAIATYHTGALHEYRHSLSHLEPPRQWAGRAKAVEFVRSLGFSEEWAGEPNAGRDPYVEVEGPYSLPELHGYQRAVVDNVRELVRSNGALGERRGMISMPTGSGKTRVAVQAIVSNPSEKTTSRAVFCGSLTATSCASRLSRRGDRSGPARVLSRRVCGFPECGLGSLDRCQRERCTLS